MSLMLEESIESSVAVAAPDLAAVPLEDRKSTRLNSSDW